MIKRSMLVFITLMLVYTNNSRAAKPLCLENVCVGDDVEELQVDWQDVKIDYKTARTTKSLLLNASVDELYYEYNEQLVTDQTTLKELVPYIIQLQKFDRGVLDKLSRVKAICTSLPLTGEIKNDSTTKFFVTFRAVADEGGRGSLKVVQVEKEFRIYPPHLRPNDKEKYLAMIETLKSDYPDLVIVRDIDARATSNDIAFSNAIVGFRFYSDVNTPLVFRLRGISDTDPIDYDPKRSAACPES